MINRPFYTLKFKSTRLKEYGYNINISFSEAKELGEIISLSDSQILRSIRDIRGIEIDSDNLERLIAERDKIKKQKESQYNRILLSKYQVQINDMMFLQDYITVVMEHPSHYKYIFQNGIIVNGCQYRRLSCSAGQARVSTVVLCNVDIIDELKRRLNNDRNLTIPIAPSKYNAYFGLSGSATKRVSEPRFIVIKDFENTVSFKANYVEETEWDKDDIITERDIVDMPMNRTDGMGLISPEQSSKWASELELDYVPSQWCVRQSFIKGMLCTFPIHEFCNEVNNGNFIVETIYKNSDGENIYVDLRDYDVILTESQFKLWNSYNNVDQYVEACHRNKLFWGVTQYSPKNAKSILNLNYQFIQTLDLGQQEVEQLSSAFIEWLNGVSYDNIAYTLLFLLGTDCNEEKLQRYLTQSDNWWVKSLILNNDIIQDKYIRSKIRDMLKVRVNNACMGDIIVDGNFQVIVSDPYAFMQHVCSLPVTGLLKQNEFYSNYWNEKNISKVDSMRSPLTYRSEHVILNLIKNPLTEKWYRYCKLGIIVNYFGNEAVRWAGSDFDYDILATTSNQIMIDNTYKDELPVVYDPPKPQKIIFTEEDLYKADTFSFGSIIGSITNKSSNAYAMLPNIAQAYGINSPEYSLTISRLKQCCKAQSAQIDKAKIGKEVKGIPKAWIEHSNDTTMNHVLLSKYPYFFRYRYKTAKSEYRKYCDETNITAMHKFNMPLDKLLSLEVTTNEQQQFIDNYYKYMPITYSNSSMNLLCRYIEEKKFAVQQNMKANSDLSFISLYKNPDYTYNVEQYKAITKILQKRVSSFSTSKTYSLEYDDSLLNDDRSFHNFKVGVECIEDEILSVCSNMYIVTNCLVDYYYLHNSGNKDLLWQLCGKYIYDNIKHNTDAKIMFPLENTNGTINYLGKRYDMVVINYDK